MLFFSFLPGKEPDETTLEPMSCLVSFLLRLSKLNKFYGSSLLSLLYFWDGWRPSTVLESSSLRQLNELDKAADAMLNPPMIDYLTICKVLLVLLVSSTSFTKTSWKPKFVCDDLSWNLSNGLLCYDLEFIGCCCRIESFVGFKKGCEKNE